MTEFLLATGAHLSIMFSLLLNSSPLTIMGPLNGPKKIEDGEVAADAVKSGAVEKKPVANVDASNEGLDDMLKAIDAK